METINNIELKNEAIFPDEKVLRGVLGKSYPAYCDLLKLFEVNQLEPEWRYYRDGKAWLCKVQKRKKTIVWMSAWKGYMQATIYVPGKHIGEILKLEISEEQKERFRQTRDVGKSRPCIFEIRESDVLRDLDQVIQIKMKLK